MSYKEGFPMDNHTEKHLLETADALCVLLLALALWKASFKIMRDMAMYLVIMIAYFTIRFGYYRSLYDLIHSTVVNTICYGVLKIIVNKKQNSRHDHVNHRMMTYKYRN